MHSLALDTATMKSGERWRKNWEPYPKPAAMPKARQHAMNFIVRDVENWFEAITAGLA